MALIETPGEFDKNKEVWHLYIDRLEQFFVANDITDEKRVPSLLLSVMGAETYYLLNDLILPAKPKSKSFKEMVDCLQNHFASLTLKIAKRSKLLKRVQKKDETVSEYAAVLRNLASHANMERF